MLVTYGHIIDKVNPKKSFLYSVLIINPAKIISFRMVYFYNLKLYKCVSIFMVNDELEFCETTQDKPSIPIAYKPAKAFATNTCIVELYRPDGMLMKIHNGG